MKHQERRMLNIMIDKDNKNIIIQAVKETGIEKDFIETQLKLQSDIDLSNAVDISKIKYVAGVDLAYWKTTVAKNIEVKNSIVENTSTKNAMAKNSEVKNAGEKNTSAKNAMAKNSEVKNAGEKNTGAQNAEVKTVDTTASISVISESKPANEKKDAESESEYEYAACCIVVIDYESKEVIERVHAMDKISVPYIPGCLAFREIPLFLKAYDKLITKPDVFVFDGNGYMHPRHMGLATHAGIIINKPTVGVAKSYYKIDDVDYEMPDEEKNSYTDIVINGDVYGRVLRTHSGVKPIFLSTGNKIDLETATELVKSLVSDEGHIPIPTRLADIMTHEVRKMYQES